MRLLQKSKFPLKEKREAKKREIYSVVEIKYFLELNAGEFVNISKLFEPT